MPKTDQAAWDRKVAAVIKAKADVAAAVQDYLEAHQILANCPTPTWEGIPAAEATRMIEKRNKANAHARKAEERLDAERDLLVQAQAEMKGTK